MVGAKSLFIVSVLYTGIIAELMIYILLKIPRKLLDKNKSTTRFFACINNFNKKLRTSLLKQILPLDDFTQYYSLR